MKIKTEIKEGIKFIKPEGPVLNITHKTRLQAILALENEKSLAIDLSAIDYVDSTILGLFLHRAQAFNKAGGNFIIYGANSTIVGLAEMTRLTYFIKIHKNKKEVIDTFGKN